MGYLNKIPLIFLSSYSVIATFYLCILDSRYSKAQEEIIRLSISLESAIDEKMRAKTELIKQNNALERYRNSLLQAKADYENKINRLEKEKHAVISKFRTESMKDSSAEKKLSLIRELLEEYLIVTEGGSNE